MKRYVIVVALVAVACAIAASAAQAQTLAWHDEFSGTRLNQQTWYVAPDGLTTGGELATCSPSMVALNGRGQLVITARKTSTGYTSGAIASNTTSMSGTIEASIKIPAGQGLWPAFFSFGSDFSSVGWPASGEMDIMENLGNNTHVVYGSVHAPDYDKTTGVTSASDLSTGFHTYSVTWTPYMVRMALDGRAYVTYMPNMPSVFGQPFYVLFCLSVGGSWPGNPNVTTRFPASLTVDWVRAYNS